MLEHTISPYTKRNPKQIKDLNIIHGTIKVVEDIIGKTFSDISYTNVFLGQFLKATETKNKSSEVKWKSLSHVWLFETPWTNSPRNSPGQNTGVGRLFLLQRIFTTQELNPGLPNCRQILYQLSHKGSPKWDLIKLKNSSFCTAKETTNEKTT